MNLFLCPVCKKQLVGSGSTFVCANGHSYDRAAAGYLHLLLPNQMNAKLPGDNKLMVDARRRFLHNGWYKPLSDKVNEIVQHYLCVGKVNSPVILDAGCGEGYYTQRLNKQLTIAGLTPTTVGIDISKLALKAAAKSCKEVHYCVASLFDIPVQTGFADCVVNIFAPVVPNEFRRVLKKGGILLSVGPAPDHLYGLKSVLYKTPTRNEHKDFQLDGFTQLDRIRLEFTITLCENEDIMNLFSMTPYFYKTPEEGTEALKSLNILSTTTAFDIAVLRAD